MSPATGTAPRAESHEPRIEAGRRVAGRDPAALLGEFGSPLYVYDTSVIERRVALLRSALPARADLAFAVKANPSPAVLRTMRASGLGADVASAGELRAVTRAGIQPRHVVFTGPGKTDAEVAEALRLGVGALTIESLDELGTVLDLAADARPGQGLMLRLATTGAEGTPIIGGAAADKFGLADEEADVALGRLREEGVLAPAGPLVLRGFHAFGASNVTDQRVLVEGVADLAGRAEALAARHGLEVEILDAGGGLGIPYAEAEPRLDIAALGEGLASETASWARRGPLRAARLLLEPGRWLVAPAGAYLIRVVRTRERGGRHIAITDGGIHHLLRPRLVGRDHRIVPIGGTADRPADARVDVVGPLCTGLDILASDVAAPVPRPGDTYAVLDAGAYGYSESMPFFLSHPVPAEVAVSGGEVTISRQRIEPA
jgi:diaminopimelate decarboxylase